MRSGAEVKVGMITLLALALVVVFALYIRGYRAGVGAYEVCVIFGDARGLQRGDPVRLAGVKIGEVESVAINRELKAEVLLRIRRSRHYTLYDSYEFRIATSGLIQERFVQVLPAPVGPTAAPLTDGVCVEGTAAPELADIVDAGLDLLENLNRTSRLVQTLLSEQEVIQGVTQALESFVEVSRAAAQVGEAARALADESRPQVVAALNDFRGAVGDLRRMASHLEQGLASETTLADLRATLASARRTTENAARLTQILADALSDPEHQRKAEETLSAVHELAISLRRVGEDLEVVSGELRRAAPAIPRVAAEAETITADLSAVRERLKPPQIDAAFDIVYAPAEGRTYPSGRLDIRTDDERFLRLGIDDIGGESDVSVQLGEPQSLAVVRYGLVRSRLGLGLDFRLPRGSALSLDISDPNALRGDVLADIPLVLGREHWSLLAGVRDVGQDPAFVAGVRLQK